MANVRDDDEETLEFADEGEWLDEVCEHLGGRVTLHPCEAKLPLNSAEGGPVAWRSICDQVGTETYIYACVHEHIVEGHTCPEHRPTPNEVGCKACWDLGHECPMVAQRAPRNIEFDELWGLDDEEFWAFGEGDI